VATIKPGLVGIYYVYIMPGKTARIFNNGGSQAVRLPAEFRFDGDEVFVRRDERTGDVILSRKRGWNTWAEYFELRDSRGAAPSGFMAERPLNSPLADKPLFDEER
jgi:antitoxin VapB